MLLLYSTNTHQPGVLLLHCCSRGTDPTNERPSAYLVRLTPFIVILFNVVSSSFFDCAPLSAQRHIFQPSIHRQNKRERTVGSMGPVTAAAIIQAQRHHQAMFWCCIANLSATFVGCLCFSGSTMSVRQNNICFGREQRGDQSSRGAEGHDTLVYTPRRV